MFTEASGIWKVILSFLFFPLFFQNDLLFFALGVDDVFWLALL